MKGLPRMLRDLGTKEKKGSPRMLRDFAVMENEKERLE